MDAGVNSEYQCQHMHFAAPRTRICFSQARDQPWSWSCRQPTIVSATADPAQCGGATALYCSTVRNHHAFAYGLGSPSRCSRVRGIEGVLARAVKPIERGPFRGNSQHAPFGSVQPMFCEFWSRYVWTLETRLIALPRHYHGTTTVTSSTSALPPKCNEKIPCVFALLLSSRRHGQKSAQRARGSLWSRARSDTPQWNHGTRQSRPWKSP